MRRIGFMASALLLAAPLAAQDAASPERAPVSPPKVVIVPPPSKQVALPGAPRPSRQTISTETSRSAPVNGVLVLYGNERCPTNSNGEEIVVCQRRDAQEQFRIPKEVRTLEITPENESWAAREKSNQDVGAVGVGSCSTVGAAGATGCFVQNARRAKREAKSRDEAATPDLDPY